MPAPAESVPASDIGVVDDNGLLCAVKIIHEGADPDRFATGEITSNIWWVTTLNGH